MVHLMCKISTESIVFSLYFPSTAIIITHDGRVNLSFVLFIHFILHFTKWHTFLYLRYGFVEMSCGKESSLSYSSNWTGKFWKTFFAFTLKRQGKTRWNKKQKYGAQSNLFQMVHFKMPCTLWLMVECMSVWRSISVPRSIAWKKKKSLEKPNGTAVDE